MVSAGGTYVEESVPVVVTGAYAGATHSASELQYPVEPSVNAQAAPDTTS